MGTSRIFWTRVVPIGKPKRVRWLKLRYAKALS